MNIVKRESISDTCKGANCVAVRNVCVTGSLSKKHNAQFFVVSAYKLGIKKINWLYILFKKFLTELKNI